MRHAKAANPDRVADVDRPLTPRGHADATAAGPWLAGRGYVPGLVLCSPARRARETWHGVATALTEAPTVRYERRLYGTSTGDLLGAVNDVDDGIGVVLLIGHNPGLSDLSALLDPGGGDANGLRTSGIAVHTLDGSWVEYGPGAAPLAETHTARG
jgi:phosphohistidine phosphatase